MPKIITASFFTTINKTKAKEALKFFWPWNWSLWQKGEYTNKLEEAIKKYIGVKYAFSFYRGRDALLASLQSLGIGSGDEVILQAFTCVSVPNAIIACGAIPVYADIIGKSKINPPACLPVQAGLPDGQAGLPDGQAGLPDGQAGRAGNQKSKTQIQSQKLNLQDIILSDTLNNTENYLFDYNINPQEIEKKITSKTKAVLVQHTFGVLANISPILEICHQYNLYLIEDCAHALGTVYYLKSQPACLSGRKSNLKNQNTKIQNQRYKAGCLGDVSIFSFGRDKIISGGSGGMLVTNSEKIYRTIKKITNFNNLETHYSASLQMISKLEILRCLFYEIIFYIGKVLYPFYLGKIIVWLAQKFSLTPKILTKEEKSGVADSRLSTPLPNALAKLAYLDFLKLEQYNTKRRQIAEIYYQELKGIKEIILPFHTKQHEKEHETTRNKNGTVFLRFAAQVREPQKLYEYLKKQGILLSNWYSNVIGPSNVDWEKVGYSKGMCPQAEQAAIRVVNLPVHQNMSLGEAKYVAQVVKSFYAK